MNINEAEKRTGLSKKTIRYYEEAGLITVKREESTGYRQIEETDINTLKRIKLYRNLGISLQDIRKVLKEEDEVTGILIKQIQSIEEQINTLQQKKKLLKSIIHNDSNDTELITDIEDVLFCHPEMVKKKLFKMDQEVIVLAAMGASPQVNAYLEELLPELGLREKQRFLGRIRIDEIENAQLEFVTKLNSPDKG